MGSVVRFTDFRCFINVASPPINRWAIFIRPLARTVLEATRLGISKANVESGIRSLPLAVPQT
jgi:hypothetical protein